MMIRVILIIAGTVSLMLGVAGVFVPGLPATPFLLLTAGCYVRSSDRLYQAMLRNRLVGRYISDWQTRKGVTRKTRIFSILLMWAMIAVSVFLMTDSRTAQGIILLAGVVGTLVMGFILPSARNSGKP